MKRYNFHDYYREKVEFKFIRIILLVSFLFFSLGGIFIYQQSVRQEEKDAVDKLSSFNERISYRINTILSEKVKIGLLLNEIITNRIKSYTPKLTESFYKRGDDNSIRITGPDRWTGVFVPEQTGLDQNLLQFIEASEQVHKEVFPFVRLSFLNIWYTTNDSAFRLTPPGSWIDEVESDYVGSEYPFYYLADEVHNPEKKEVWTPLYYDDRLDSWMTSLIFPHYEESTLLGVSGNDYDLQRIFDEFLHMAENESGINSFIFDSSGHMVIHPEYMDLIHNSWMENKSLMDARDINEKWAYDFLNRYYESGEAVQYSEHLSISGEDHLVIASSIGFQGWHIGSYESTEHIRIRTDKLFFQIILGIIAFTLIISVLIALWVKKLILSRLFIIKTYIDHFVPGGDKNSLHIKGNDEISKLASSLLDLTGRLNRRIDFEKIISDISKNLNMADEDALDETITSCLEIIGIFAQADRSYLFFYSDDKDFMNNTHEWTKKGIPPEKEFYTNFPSSKLGWLNEQLLQNLVVSIPDTDFLPVEAKEAQYYIQNASGPAGAIKSLVCSPIHTGNKVIGFVGFDSVKENKDWNMIDTKLLKFVGQMFLDNMQRVKDAVEKKKMREMVVQSEKMLSVGGLAAGMAHEINNPLAGMIQTANVLSKRLLKEDSIRNETAAKDSGTTMGAVKRFMEAREIPRMLKSINDSGERIATIVADMLNFARRSDGEVTTQHLENIIERSLNLASSDYDLKKQYDFKKIKIIKEYEKNLPPVPCESAKIEQVLLNIFRNGAQALYEDKTASPRFTIYLNQRTDREMLSIEIEDNGPGMSKNVMERIFDPFFTTKPAGEGTGLGLSVSYFIITENHNGEMSVASEQGIGSRFSISLPIVR